MNRLLKFTIFCISFASMLPLSAQYRGQSRFFVGAHATGYYSMIVNQNNYGLPEMNYRFDPLPSFGGGIIAGVHFNNSHQIQVEFNAVNLKQKYEDNYTYGNHFNLKKSIESSYFQMPILYRYVFGADVDAVYMDNAIKFYVTAGPQLDMLLNAKVQYKVDDINSTWRQVDVAFGNGLVDGADMGGAFECGGAQVQEPFDGASLYEKIGISGVIGGGIQKCFNDHFLVGIEMRAAMSITDINAKCFRVKNRRDIYEPSRGFAGSLRISCSYLF